MEAVAALPGGERVRFVDAYSFMFLLKTFEQTKWDRPIALGPFSEAAEISFAAPDLSDGLFLAKVADGPFEFAKTDGQDVIRQSRSEAVRYLYYRVGDGFGRSPEWGAGMDLVVTVTLLDTSGGRIGVQYDTLENSHQLAGASIDLTGTGEWRDISFPLSNARFDHGQNAAASFRLVNFGGDLVVKSVSVRRKNP